MCRPCHRLHFKLVTDTVAVGVGSPEYQLLFKTVGNAAFVTEAASSKKRPAEAMLGPGSGTQCDAPLISDALDVDPLP